MTLEITNLSKKYADDYVLRDFSYKFKERGLYLIVGNSGSGNSGSSGSGNGEAQRHNQRQRKGYDAAECFFHNDSPFPELYFKIFESFVFMVTV